jgi:uncharacterized protein YdhG (YjbR/CyaY superfamily)
MNDNKPPATVAAYIANLPAPVQEILEQVRAAIRRVAPDAHEAIKYGIPTFVLNGNLVHYAAFKRHIGFYPTPSAIEAFADELAEYQCSKGSVQFPLGEPIPLGLIERIVEFRVAQARARR